MRDILIAEDNALLANGICTALKSERYRVRHVADGAAALAAIAEQRPDVLVLDIMMPNTDGITVCRTIRRTDAHLPSEGRRPDGRDAHRSSGEQPTGGPEMVRREARLKREVADFAGTGLAVAKVRKRTG